MSPESVCILADVTFFFLQKNRIVVVDLVAFVTERSTAVFFDARATLVQLDVLFMMITLEK